MNGPISEGLEALMSKHVQELGEMTVRASRAGRRITLMASLLLASTALAATPEQGAEAKPDAETQAHASAPAVIVPIERPAVEGVLVLPRLPDPAPPAMPAELEEQRRASLAAPAATPVIEPPVSDSKASEPKPAEPAPFASLDRIIIETPPAPVFDLSILEREKRPLDEPAATAPQLQAGPIIIERPAPPEFDLSSLKVEPPKRAEPIAPLPYRLAIAPDAAKALIEPHRQRLRLKPSVTDQIVATYETREWQSFWLMPDGTAGKPVSGLVAQLSAAGEDGLDANRLLSLLPPSLSDFTKAEPIAEEKRAEIDLLLSLAAVAYAQDARGGRLEPAKLSAMLTPELFLPPAGDVLERTAKAETAEAVRKVLDGYNPQHEGYRALKQALARLRVEPAHEPEATATALKPATLRAELPANFMEGTLLVPGQEDARVPHIRRRLGLPAGEQPVYDVALADAVKEFQRANGLKPDGRITPRTRALLQDLDAPVNREQRAKLAPDDRTATLIANMERWRWLPPELGRTHIFVNIPDFRLEVMDEGARIFETRVIVGKPERQTPVFSDKMEFLVVNPSWYIPPTILKKDVLPKLAADPTYAARMGYQVIRNGNSVSVRQPPGERNALGHVKFMFPNAHAVYLHDTPGRHLFRNETRAYSSGCVRVDQPFALAEQLLLKKQGFSERQLRAMVGGGERTIKLTETVPVHLAYFTLSVDAAGVLVRKPDLYGHDARIRRALSL
jgi:murein L,D-transpeptidase YcbB/YkuD